MDAALRVAQERKALEHAAEEAKQRTLRRSSKISYFRRLIASSVSKKGGFILSLFFGKIHIACASLELIFDCLSIRAMSRGSSSRKLESARLEVEAAESGLRDHLARQRRCEAMSVRAQRLSDRVSGFAEAAGQVIELMKELQQQRVEEWRRGRGRGQRQGRRGRRRSSLVGWPLLRQVSAATAPKRRWARKVPIDHSKCSLFPQAFARFGDGDPPRGARGASDLDKQPYTVVGGGGGR